MKQHVRKSQKILGTKLANFQYLQLAYFFTVFYAGFVLTSRNLHFGGKVEVCFLVGQIFFSTLSVPEFKVTKQMTDFLPS